MPDNNLPGGELKQLL